MYRNDADTAHHRELADAHDELEEARRHRCNEVLEEPISITEPTPLFDRVIQIVIGFLIVAVAFAVTTSITECI